MYMIVWIYYVYLYVCVCVYVCMYTYATAMMDGRKSGHVWATSSSREDMTWTYHDLIVNSVRKLEQNHMEKIFLTILIYFGWSLHLCWILWGDSFKSNIFELVSCRFNVVFLLGDVASLIRWFWGGHFMPVANPAAGYKKLRKNSPRKNYGRSQKFGWKKKKCSSMWEILEHIGTMALWLDQWYSMMIVSRIIVSLMFQHG